MSKELRGLQQHAKEQMPRQRGITRPKAPGEIQIKRTRSNKVTLVVKLVFSPKALGEDRTNRIWEGVGKMLAGIFTPEEAAEFGQRLKAAAAKAAVEKP